MVLLKFVQKAIQCKNGELHISLPDYKGSIANECAIAHFTGELLKSGAKVSRLNSDFFISPSFGLLPKRLYRRTRKDIRKSMAVYRIRPRINFKHRAQIGVADLGAILLDKSTIIKLQLLNECSRAVLLLYAGDIISHLGQVNDLVDSRKVQDGYFVTGRMYSVYTVPNMVRNIYDLTVYIIEDKETQF